KRVLIIGKDDKVWKVGLGLRGVHSVFSRSNDDSRLTSIELIVMCFELTQLDHAKRSPSSAEEDDRVALASHQIAFGNDRSIASAGGQVRTRPPNGHPPRVLR